MSSLLFGNGTDIVHWKPSPKTRGTFDILTTCIVTMLLCVWTAVHLNVPPPGSTWGPRLRKVGWLILTLVAPEVVAYTAWYQRQEALSTTREFNKAFGLSNPPSWYETKVKNVKNSVTGIIGILTHQKQKQIRHPTLESQPSPEDRHPWTIVHGFYANMGGIAIETPEKKIPKSKGLLFSHRKETWFITKELIELLLTSEAERKILPDLSREEIESKSKANGLAKGLVCMQALWFIAQCITRLARQIPISLLELNTFAHAVCALLIYFLWWEKPFEVDYPSMIEGECLRDFYALNWIRTNRSPAIESYYRDLEVWLANGKRSHTQKSNKDPSKVLHSWTGFDLLDFASDRPADFHKTGHSGEDEASSTVLMPGETVPGTWFRLRDISSLAKRLETMGPIESHSGSHSPLPKLTLTTEDVIRYKMAWRALEIWGIFREGLSDEVSFSISGFQVHYENIPRVVQRCKDWPNIEKVLELPIALGFTTAAIIYGGLHALAWVAHFDSSTQQLLWRVSACVVMGGLPPILVLGAVLMYLIDCTHRSHHILGVDFTPRDHDLLGVGFYPRNNHISDASNNCLMWTVLVMVALAALAYILARGYLVAECFINLSHLPAGVYDVPQWSAYIPHIS